MVSGGETGNAWMVSHGFRAGQPMRYRSAPARCPVSDGGTVAGRGGQLLGHLQISRLELDPDRVEDPVDERPRVVVAELLGDLDRLVDHHHARRGRKEEELV